VDELSNAVDVVEHWAAAAHEWDVLALLRSSSMSLRLADAYLAQTDWSGLTDSWATLTDVGAPREIGEGLIEVPLSMKCGHQHDDGLRHESPIEAVRLRSCSGVLLVDDYLEDGDWVSARTCVHFSSSLSVGGVLVRPLFYRQLNADQHMWEFYIVNTTDQQRNVRLAIGAARSELTVAPRRFQMVIVTGAVAPPASLKIRVLWLRPFVRYGSLPLMLQPGHPTSGWCQGYSYLQRVLHRTDEGLNASALTELIPDPGPPSSEAVVL